MSAKTAVKELDLKLPKTLKLETKEAQNILRSWENDDFVNQCNDLSNIRDLIKKGETSISFDDKMLFHCCLTNYFVYDKKTGVVKDTGLSDLMNITKSWINARLKEPQVTSVVLLPSKTKNQALFPILNGDENADNAPDFLDNIGTDGKIDNITISFECLSKFYNDAEDVAQKLSSGEIKLVDYKPDSKKSLTSEEKKLFSKWIKSRKGPNPLIAPVGYTLVGHQWHRSATVLFYDVKGKFSIIMGQDEGAYFGCELADNPKTVDAAYKSLMPPAARRSTFQRQGEWFAIPVDENDIPSVENCVLEANTLEGGDFSLNRDSIFSAYHFLISAEIRVGKDGIVYANNSILRHSNDDHYDLESKDWVAFHRNTAKRSFSVEGVD